MHVLKQLPPAPPGINLGGRGWRVIDCDAVRQKAREWILPQLRAHGIRMQAQPGESARAFAECLFGEVRASSVMFKLLGFLLIPDELADQQWCPALAVRTEKFIAKLWRERDKETVGVSLVLWSLGRAGIDLDKFLGLSPLATKWRM